MTRLLIAMLSAIALAALAACNAANSPDVQIVVDKRQQNYINAFNPQAEAPPGFADATPASTDDVSTDDADESARRGLARIGDTYTTGDGSGITYEISYTTASEQSIAQESMLRLAAELAAAFSGQGTARAEGGGAEETSSDQGDAGGDEEPPPD